MRHASPITRAKVSAVAAIAVCAVSFAAASAQTSFLDDFRDQDIGDGQPVTWLPGGAPDGERDASSGDLVHVPEQGSGTSTYVVDPVTREGWRYDDVLLNTRIHVDDADAGYVAMYGRSTGSVGTVYGAIKPVHSEAAIGVIANGQVEILATEMPLFSLVGNDVNLQMLIAGDQVNLWAWDTDGPPPEQPLLTATLPAAFPNSTGTIGVDTIQGFGGHARKTTFRHFEAKQLDDVRGDFNSDGLISIVDLDSLVSAQGEVIYSPLYDVDGDKIITDDDIPSWLSLAADNDGRTGVYVTGDTNLDGTVDATDLNALALNWQQDVQQWSAGDFDASGSVDAADLNELALNWRNSIPRAVAPVPEPAGLLLIYLGLGLLCWSLRTTE